MTRDKKSQRPNVQATGSATNRLKRVQDELLLDQMQAPGSLQLGRGASGSTRIRHPCSSGCHSCPHRVRDAFLSLNSHSLVMFCSPRVPVCTTSVQYQTKNKSHVL